MRRKIKVLMTVLKRTNATKIIAGFVVFFFIVSLIILLVEPNINRYQDALWYSYSVFSTIGFGDEVSVTFVGHFMTVLLSISAIVVIAVVTGVIVAFYNETVSIQYKASKAEVLDKLLRLPELSKEELEEVSEQIRKIL